MATSVSHPSLPAPSRIAVVTPRFSVQATIGGAETLLKNLAQRLTRRGHSVDVLTTCAEDHFTWANSLPASRTMVEGMTVIRFPVDSDRDVDAFLRAQTMISQGEPVTDEVEAIWMRHNVNSQALYEHLRTAGADYDRIIAGPYLFSLIYEAALIHPQKTYLAPCLHDEAFARLRVMQTLFDGVAGFLFNTDPERELAERLFGATATKGTVVGMGLEPFEGDPHAFARSHNLAQPYLLYSGRREPLKGTPLLLDYLFAFRQRTRRDVRLVFTGSGPIEPSPELAPYLLDVGFVSEQEKHEAMAGATAFVHPSINESLGIVLLEAWLARAPALVHASGAVLRWQCRQSGGGLWFRHYPDFEEELVMLLDQPDMRRQLGAAGRAYVERAYSWAAVEQRLCDALGLR